METIRSGMIGCRDVAEIKSGPGFYKARNSTLVAVMRRNGDHIMPGKPDENGFTERLNGRRRDEYFNERWFSTLAEARQLAEESRQDYNNVRLHSSLNCLTPAEFKQQQGADCVGLVVVTSPAPFCPHTPALKRGEDSTSPWNIKGEQVGWCRIHPLAMKLNAWPAIRLRSRPAAIAFWSGATHAQCHT